MTVELRQERHVELVGGATQAFVITSEVHAITPSVPPSLPHVNIFVLNVVDVTDPKKDTLVRVGTLADITTLPIGRTAGIARPSAAGILYLSSTVTVSYDTLEVANTAAKTFKDRINALITSWVSFSTDFLAVDPTPAIYFLPSVDVSHKTALINAYAVAKQDRYQKQLAKDGAQADLDTAQKRYVYCNNLFLSFKDVDNSSSTVINDVTAVVNNFNGLSAASNLFYGFNAGPPTPPHGAEMAAALATAATQATAMTTYINVDCSSLTSYVSDYRSHRQTDVTNATTTVNTAQSTFNTATQALTLAQATESAALAAVLAICPDFDPKSIPLVPDV